MYILSTELAGTRYATTKPRKRWGVAVMVVVVAVVEVEGGSGGGGGWVWVGEMEAVGGVGWLRWWWWLWWRRGEEADSVGDKEAVGGGGSGCRDGGAAGGGGRLWCESRKAWQASLTRRGGWRLSRPKTEA